MNRAEATLYLKNHDQYIRGTELLPFHVMEGFLFSVCTYPELIRPSEWLPVIWGDNLPFEDVKEADAYCKAVMAIYNGVNDDVRNGRIQTVETAPFNEVPMANFAMGCPMQQWSDGVSLGEEWLSDACDELFAMCRREYGRKYDDIFVDRVLSSMILTLFADEALARDRFTKHTGGATFEEFVADAVRTFNKELKRYMSFRTRLEHVVTELPADILDKRPGRNDLCPCGSGKKFKKCCGKTA